MDIVDKARVFALAAYTAVGKPHLCQQEMAIDVLRRGYHTQAMLAATWLGRIVEETQVTYQVLLEEFGTEVVRLSQQLTQSSFWNGNKNTVPLLRVVANNTK